MPYCTIAQARAAGATGDDTAVSDAIALATEVIDQFTGDIFEQRALTLVATLAGGGLALLPYRLATSPAPTVRYVGATTDLDPATYTVRTAATVGDINAIELRSGGSDILIAGAEPWSGGFANLARSGRRLRVTGTFGWEATPLAVQRACALLAASRTKHPEGNSEAGVESLSVEGYSVRYGDAGGLTTGVAEADRLLRPYRQMVLA